MEEFAFEKMVCECKEIPGFPGYYVNSYGRIWSDKTHHWLRQYDNGDGYLQVRLWSNGKMYVMLVHRLVAICFVENDSPDTKDTVDHIDNNRRNNAANNLQWLSRADNVRKGRCKPLTIYNRFTGQAVSFDSQAETAWWLEVCPQYVSQLVCGRIPKIGPWTLTPIVVAEAIRWKER